MKELNNSLMLIQGGKEKPPGAITLGVGGRVCEWQSLALKNGLFGCAVPKERCVWQAGPNKTLCALQPQKEDIVKN